MQRWALAFFVIALVAAVIGFSTVAVAAAGISKIMFFLFLFLCLLTLIGHEVRQTRS